jgi:hypothetical protein
MYDRANPRLLDALEEDDAVPMDPKVRSLWVRNLRSPLRRNLLSLVRIVRTLTLYLFYFFRRALPGFLQFSFPGLLQRIICFFMEWFVAPEANYLILNHFWTESNLLNFIIANSRNGRSIEPVALYPERIRDLLTHTFVKHDIAMFNALHDLGPVDRESWPVPPGKLDFSTMRPPGAEIDPDRRRWTQFIDFETAHELFKATFCLLLTWEEYERSTTSLQFDQSLAVRIAGIVGDPSLADLASNRYPLLITGPTGIGRRFILHGLFVEYMHERLMRLAKGTVPKA